MKKSSKTTLLSKITKKSTPTSKQESLGFKIAKILWLKRRLIDNEMKKLSFSRTQWLTLYWLNQLHPCSQKELLRHMDIDAAQLARNLDDFEKNGYIIRTKIPEDRRSLLIELTDHTKKQLIPYMEKVFKKENDVLLNGLSPTEKNKLINLLDKIKNNIELELLNLEERK